MSMLISIPRRSTGTLLLALAALTTSPLAQAADPAAPPLLPISDFAKRPKLTSVQFSPDGQLFAALQDYNGRANLVVGSLEKNQLTRITSFTTYDVASYRWISNSRLILNLGDETKGLAEQRGGGLFALNADGSQPKELSPTFEACGARIQICRQTRFIRRIAEAKTR